MSTEAIQMRAVEDWIAQKLRALQPAERRRLTTSIAKALRQRQAANIAAQRGPDGDAWEPRKPQNLLRARARGGIRKAAKKQGRPMFAKLRQARYLKAQGTQNEAIVQFFNKAARIARVHHFGLSDNVNEQGPRIDYPERPLLGIDSAAVDMVRDLLLAHFGR